jgi:hypothetical protein
LLLLFYVPVDRRKEVKRDWRKLHSKELCDLYVPLNIIKIKEEQMRGACGTSIKGEISTKFTSETRNVRGYL